MNRVRLRIYDALGVFKHTRDNYYSDLTRFAITPAGDCGEAELTGLAEELGINPRDIIVLQASDDDGVTWRNQYRGVCMVAGAKRKRDLSEFRFVGLRQRLFERSVQGYKFAGKDLGLLVREIVSYNSNANLPEGVTYNSSLVPAVGFEVGDLLPNARALGEVLERLADLAPAFEVPAGQSYSYGGDVYYAGETVPAMAFGVNADGEFFFRRPRKDAILEVSDTDAGVSVEWRETSAEEVVTRPSIIVGRSTELGMFEDAKQYVEPLKGVTYADPVGVSLYGNVDKTIPVEAETMYLEINTIPWQLMRGTLISGSLTDLQDADSSTKVVIETTGNPAGLGYIVQLRATLPAGTLVDGFVLTKDNALQTMWAFTPSGATYYATDWDGAELNGLIYAPTTGALPVATDFDIFFRVDAQTELEFTDVYLFRLRTELLTELAKSFVKLPPLEAATLRVPEHLDSAYRQVNLSITGEPDPIEMEVKQLEFTPSRERGAETLLRLGQRLDAFREQESAVIRGISDRLQQKELTILSNHNIPTYRRPAVIALPNGAPGNTIPPTDEEPEYIPGTRVFRDGSNTSLLTELQEQALPDYETRFEWGLESAPGTYANSVLRIRNNGGGIPGWAGGIRDNDLQRLRLGFEAMTPAEHMEVVAQVRITPSQNITASARLGFGIYLQATSSTSGYAAQLELRDGTNATLRILEPDESNPATEVAVPLSKNVFNWMRFGAIPLGNGGVQLRAKVWAGADTAEPTSWTLTHDVDPNFVLPTLGYAAFSNWSNISIASGQSMSVNYDVARFGVGINEAPAPKLPLT